MMHQLQYIWLPKAALEIDFARMICRAKRKMDVQKSQTRAAKIGSFVCCDNGQRLVLVAIYYFKLQNVVCKMRKSIFGGDETP